MPYSAKADILTELSEDQLIQLTDDEGAGIVSDTRVTAAIARADAVIDSYCGQVAEVPFTSVPAVILRHSITLAIYFLFGRRSAIPESRSEAYKDAIAHLRDIAIGKAALPPVAEEDAAAEPQSSHTSADRKFTRGKVSDGSSGKLDNY